QIATALAEALVETGEGRVGIGAALGALVADAQRVVKAATDRASKRIRAEQLVEERRKGLGRAENAAAAVAVDLERWRADWRAAVVPLGLAPATSPTEAEGFVELLQEAFQALDSSATLERLIRRIEEDRREFTASVRELVADVAEDLHDADPE